MIFEVLNIVTIVYGVFLGILFFGYDRKVKKPIQAGRDR
jgi:hypothetical protein